MPRRNRASSETGATPGASASPGPKFATGVDPSFGARLLAWYDRHCRDLPWRRQSTPWTTWVSEVMLQQTRVEVVAPAFARFVARFPTVADFASATDDALQHAWRGLGYYRRARLLREGARQVVERHGGAIPADPTAIAELAGVGEYTAGAIASIAFGAVTAAIDGNVERVFARHAGIDADVKRSATRRQLRALVLERIDAARPGDFNQALMDLGATVCTPRNPRCTDCPVGPDCVAYAEGRQHELPRLPARRAAVPITARAVLVRDRAERVLAARIPAGAINEGQWELPTPGILVDVPDDDGALAYALVARYGTRFEVGPRLAAVRHGITNHRITLEIHTATLVGRPGGGLRFVAPTDPDLPWSTPSRKALRALRQHPAPDGAD